MGVDEAGDVNKASLLRKTTGQEPGRTEGQTPSSLVLPGVFETRPTS